MKNQITWAQAQQLLAPVLRLEHSPEDLYEQTGDLAALATAVGLWSTQPRHTIDATAAFDLTDVIEGLDRLLGSLQQVRHQLDSVARPPKPVLCYGTSCRWVGTTDEAAWNADDQEYRCPECGSSQLIIDNPVRAAEMAVTWSQTVWGQERAAEIFAALDRIAAWKAPGRAEANHEHT